MQAALRQGRLGEALEQAHALPPKAAQAGEEWIAKAKARLANDRGVRGNWSLRSAGWTVGTSSDGLTVSEPSENSDCAGLGIAFILQLPLFRPHVAQSRVV